MDTGLLLLKPLVPLYLEEDVLLAFGLPLLDEPPIEEKIEDEDVLLLLPIPKREAAFVYPQAQLLPRPLTSQMDDEEGK